MATNDPCVVVLQLTGGNDYLNAMIPYNNPLYRDNRPAVGIGDNQIIHLDKDYGIPDYMAPMKKFWDEDKLAVLHGVGFKDSPRSHFRAMDIWHTCEPEKVGTEGWLAVSPANTTQRRKTSSRSSAWGRACRGPLYAPACRLPAWLGPWSGTGSCRRCRARSAPKCSIALQRCTARRSAAAR